MNLKSTFFGILIGLGLVLSAQAQENIRIGAMLAYGSEIENPGIGVNAEISIMENLNLAPSLIYFIPKEQYGFKTNWFEISANANYYFLKQSGLNVYALGGLNYTHLKTSYDGKNIWGVTNDVSASEGRFGLNLGGGVNFPLGKITPFAEVKYVVIEDGQVVAGAGVKFNL